MLERRVANLTIPVAIHLGVLTAECLQFIEHLATAPHLLHRVRAEKVEIDLVQFMRVFAVVALRPFLGIADSSHRAQVGTGHQIRLGGILNQVRERQFGCIRMMCMSSHDQRESTYLTGPQHVTVAGGLRSSLHHTLVNRTEFVHMIRLVASRACIHEREHTGNEQRRFMVRYGVRPCEDSACLAVHTLTVREE